MNEPELPDGGAHPDDAALLAELGRVVAMVDPVPPGLVERVQFALELEDLDVEVARWERNDRLAGVRSIVDQGTITFTVSDLTVMINLTKTGRCHRIDGWLVRPGSTGSRSGWPSTVRRAPSPTRAAGSCSTMCPGEQRRS
jgi:hypothetical protein